MTLPFDDRDRRARGAGSAGRETDRGRDRRRRPGVSSVAGPAHALGVVVRDRLAASCRREPASSRSGRSATVTSSSPTRSSGARSHACRGRSTRRRAPAAWPNRRRGRAVADPLAALADLARAARDRLADRGPSSRSRARRARPSPRTSPPPRLRPGALRAREPGLVQQRVRAAPHAARRRPRVPRSSSPRWARASPATSPSCAQIARPDVGASSRTSASPTPSTSVAATGSRGSRASCSTRCPPSGLAVLNADDEHSGPLAGAHGGAGPARRAPRGRRRRASATSRSTPSCARASCSRRPGATADVRARRTRRAPGHERRAGRHRGARPRRRPRRRRRRARRRDHGDRGGWSSCARRTACIVLNDAYNSSPTSAAAALRRSRPSACRGRRIAVLGEMLELGEHSEAEHAASARLAADPASTSSSRSGRPPARPGPAAGDAGSRWSSPRADADAALETRDRRRRPRRRGAREGEPRRRSRASSPTAPRPGRQRAR